MLKVIKEDTKGGAITNKAFYEMSERILKVMSKLEITNSFSTNAFGIITAQTEVMMSALEIIEDTVDEHINDYIETEF